MRWWVGWLHGVDWGKIIIIMLRNDDKHFDEDEDEDEEDVDGTET